ncbi:hypothetical protein DFH08DRAFT_826027 [Mycena albidolilacea]|uniref:Uncharacterized protein n=1 Tax=Mycena albidolilacea TaxID=1033008 RepID=A0AAD6Z1W4_9AGAR|nr:hypothetical protein DFH08DRAFT_826027 [Mycena albidolilacea]
MPRNPAAPTDQQRWYLFIAARAGAVNELMVVSSEIELVVAAEIHKWVHRQISIADFDKRRALTGLLRISLMWKEKTFIVKPQRACINGTKPDATGIGGYESEYDLRPEELDKSEPRLRIKIAGGKSEDSRRIAGDGTVVTQLYRIRPAVHRSSPVNCGELFTAVNFFIHICVSGVEIKIMVHNRDGNREDSILNACFYILVGMMNSQYLRF